MADSSVPDISMESASAPTTADAQTDQAASTSASAPADAKVVAAPLNDRALDDDEKAAVRQVEFYFADSNLPYDKFMWGLHSKSPEHWVEIDQVASFKRMQEFKPRGRDWLVNALRYSIQLEVDSESVHVRRRTEVKEPKGQLERSVYAKGFPKEENTQLQKQIENFFKAFGNVSAVRLRRDDHKLFKGSVFCEFTDFATVGAFLAAKPEYDGQPLEIYTKEAYVNKKIKEKGLTGSAATIRRQSMARRGFNAFEEMRRAAGVQPTSEAYAKDVFLDFFNTRIRVHGTTAEEAHVKEEDIPKIAHTTLRFSGCGGKASFNDIKPPLKERFSRPPFIKYIDGEDSGLVGFDRALTDDEVDWVKKVVPKINDRDVTWEFIDFDVERPFQIERAQSAARRVFSYITNPREKPDNSRTQKDSASHGRGRGRGGRARGGRGGGRGAHGGRGGARGAASVSVASSSPSSSTLTPASAPGEEKPAEKRKRAVEPDGGHDAGVRGATVPTVVSAKKQKTEEAA